MARSGHRTSEHQRRLAHLNDLQQLITPERQAEIAREVRERMARRAAQVKES